MADFLHKIEYLCSFWAFFLGSFFVNPNFCHTFVANNFQSSKKYNYVRN